MDVMQKDWLEVVKEYVEFFVIFIGHSLSELFLV